MHANDHLKNELLERLRTEGFDAAGIGNAEAPAERAIRLNAFLGAGWLGEMDWLAKRAHWRGNPKTLWPEAKSAIVVGMSYAPQADPLGSLTRHERGVISVYAQGTDYHDVLKKKLKRVASWLALESAAGVKVFVDTAPVMEKPLAQISGIGWQGKHTNLVSREHGSWLFLGVILSAYEFAFDTPHEDRCGNCHACLDICPTKAFPAPYQLDARRCISYLTIEHRGPIPHEFRKAIGNRIYGCDDCLAVCPWNKFAERTRESAFHAREELAAPLLRDLAALDDAAFRKLFVGSAIKRIGRDQFIRNVLIAIGNSEDAALAECALALLEDPSPLVRGASVWALSQLLTKDEFARLAAGLVRAETDETVLAEWTATR